MIFKQDDRGCLDIHDISVNVLDLDKTLDCGETFRWNKISTNIWQGVIDNFVVLLKQDREKGIIYTNMPFNRKDVFVRYFDLDTDYSGINKLDLSKDAFALESIKAGSGIRILRQDLWETIVSFIISQRNNIPKIKSSVSKLCDIAGGNAIIYNREKFGVQSLYGSRSLMLFPTPEQIVEHAKEIRLNCSLGYRADYIIDLANSVCRYNKNKGRQAAFTSDLTKLSKDNQYEVLVSIRGIGPKVANCIMLFGLHHIDSFPIDTWMMKIADTYYNGALHPERYGEYAGIIQQYMFYNVRS